MDVHLQKRKRALIETRNIKLCQMKEKSSSILAAELTKPLPTTHDLYDNKFREETDKN